ncbi:MAG: IS3 family transposase [Francisellaceae bacterium]
MTEHKLQSSMSGKGCCYDNAACESFFGTLKTEVCDDENYQTAEAAKSSLFEYIEGYYNRLRNIQR